MDEITYVSGARHSITERLDLLARLGERIAFRVQQAVRNRTTIRFPKAVAVRYGEFPDKTSIEVQVRLEVIFGCCIEGSNDIAFLNVSNVVAIAKRLVSIYAWINGSCTGLVLVVGPLTAKK